MLLWTNNRYFRQENIKGTMGEISVILAKHYFFILLNKFNIYLIYGSLKFQTSITDVQSFIMRYVNFYAI